MTDLRATAEAYGIAPSYEDAFGNWTEVPDETLVALVEAMGGDPHGPGPEPGDPSTGPVRFTRPGEHVEVGRARLVLEDGTGRDVDGALPGDLPLGYHDLYLDGRDEPQRLVVSPGRCWLPERLRRWGWAAQLYEVRSRESWGIGDLADLRRLGEWSADLGARVVLCNPFGAVNPRTPRETSPYYPTSRRYRDPIYLRVEEVPGADHADVDLTSLAAAGRALNDDRVIDRDEVGRLKLAALEQIWDTVPGVRDDERFRAYVAEQGTALTRFATFMVAAERHGERWREWPASLSHPDRAVDAMAGDDRVDFHRWCQWLLDEQLRHAGDAIDLMADLPIGFDPRGADAWAWQDLVADGVSIGAPPDRLARQGQDWQLPPLIPHRLRAAGYEPIVQTLRSAFRHAGALRIDHALGLFRLFWIPPGAPASAGAYVRMPADELLDVLALESHRAGAFVVGEDLGTVPPGVRPTLTERHILRYRVLWFEDEHPHDWDELALASVTTHDVATVAGVWTGADARMQESIGLDSDAAWHEELRERIRERTGVAGDASAAEVSRAVHGVLAGSPASVVVAQLEDALAVEERPNVPGTERATRANWSLALPVPLEDLVADPRVRAVAQALGAADR